MLKQEPKRIEHRLGLFLKEHPEGCEISFRAGWLAAENAEQKVEPHHPHGEKHHLYKPDLSIKYSEAKKLLLKGFTRKEACEIVDMSYDAFMRRQRIERYGKDRYWK